MSRPQGRTGAAAGGTGHGTFSAPASATGPRSLELGMQPIRANPGPLPGAPLVRPRDATGGRWPCSARAPMPSTRSTLTSFGADRALSRRLGVPDASAEDVAQDVFLVVHRRQADYEPRTPIKYWVFGIVSRVVADHRRTYWRKEAHGNLPGLRRGRPRWGRDAPCHRPDAERAGRARRGLSSRRAPSGRARQ